MLLLYCTESKRCITVCTEHWLRCSGQRPGKMEIKRGGKSLEWREGLKRRGGGGWETTMYTTLHKRKGTSTVMWYTLTAGLTCLSTVQYVIDSEVQELTWYVAIWNKARHGLPTCGMVQSSPSRFALATNLGNYQQRTFEQTLQHAITGRSDPPLKLHSQHNAPGPPWQKTRQLKKKKKKKKGPPEETQLPAHNLRLAHSSFHVQLYSCNTVAEVEHFFGAFKNPSMLDLCFFVVCYKNTILIGTSFPTCFESQTSSWTNT